MHAALDRAFDAVASAAGSATYWLGTHRLGGGSGSDGGGSWGTDPLGTGPAPGAAASGSAAIPGSHDPNEKTGPGGFGPAGYLIPTANFPYRIEFENDPTATAPAQRVLITDLLDPSLDLNTFALTEAGFGDNLIDILAGAQELGEVPGVPGVKTWCEEVGSVEDD